MNSDLFLIVSEADPIESRQVLLVYNDRETAERHLGIMNQYDSNGPFLIVERVISKLTKGNKKNITRLLLYKQRGECCYCKKILGESRKRRIQYHHDDVTIEHLHRVTDGGANGLSNIALACDECNRGRGDIDWMTYKSYKMNEIIL